jgi:ankyrin repeat protein
VNRNDYTALIEAVKAGNKESVRLLIDAGADVNFGGRGNTALSWAKSVQQEEIARMLEAAGGHE